MLNQPPNVSLAPAATMPQGRQYLPIGTIIRPGYNGKTARFLGSLMVAAGLFLIVFQITAIIIALFYFYQACGIWTGTLVCSLM